MGGSAFALTWHPRRKTPASLRADPHHILDLPPGFRYRILERAEDRMSDGLPVPRSPDGMGCMVHPKDPSKLILLRNHELPAPDGGVTRLVLDAKTFTRVSSNRILSGTDLNCAGGLFPGVGWLSCEESDQTGHGYVYLCDALAERETAPDRKPGYGRFRHEAVAIVPGTHVAYLTEDRPNGCFYRFVPRSASDPFAGQLQALCVKGRLRFDTADMAAHAEVAVTWVDLPETDLPDDGLATLAASLGAARVKRAEGITQHGGRIYFCATTGGRASSGQIFELIPGEKEDRLRVVAESTSSAILDMPDNITVAPNGDLIVAEDDGAGESFIRGVRLNGEVYDLALNQASPRELAGVCFSPDGRALFLNMYAEGFTVVVHREDLGPWPDHGLAG